MAHIFISYAHTDHQYARKLADFLLENGFDVWIDDRIDFGSRWIREIFGAIEECAAFIVIMTPRAFEREWVENERLYAKKRGKIVFPLLLEGDSFPDLGATQYYEVIGGKLPDAAFLERLAEFAPRRESAGQNIAVVPQQQAKREHETAEIAKASAPVQTAGAVEATSLDEAPVDKVLAEAAPPPAQAARRTPGSPQRSSQGVLVFAAAALIVAIAAALIISLNPGILGGDRPSAASTPVATPFGGGHEEIAFQSTRDDNTDLYLMNSDGSNIRRLTSDPAYDGDASWSPDGARIVFTSLRDNGNQMLYLINADGSNVERVPNVGSGWNPAWSPDGMKIVFTAQGNIGTEIYYVELNGSQPQTLTNNNADEDYSAWSPDGEKIVFMSQRDGNEEIYVMSADGSNVLRLTDNPANDTVPSWSPDGTQIAFQSDRDGYARVYVMNADGSNPHPFTNAPGDSYEPAWSADGTQVIFPSYRESNDAKLYIADADGTNVRRVANTAYEERFPAWRP